MKCKVKGCSKKTFFSREKFNICENGHLTKVKTMNENQKKFKEVFSQINTITPDNEEDKSLREYLIRIATPKMSTWVQNHLSIELDRLERECSSHIKDRLDEEKEWRERWTKVREAKETLRDIYERGEE